jgi:uncharacterized membrane protein (DUF4010 family)
MFSTLPGQLLLAILIGAAIGLEREKSNGDNDPAAGVRTFSITSLLGAIAGIFYINNFPPLAMIIAGSFSLLIIAYYMIGSLITRDIGLTSEIAIIATFFIGSLITVNVIPLRLLVALAVALITILSLKSKTRKIVAGLSGNEIQSFVGYAIIALIVFPFLPNYGYKLSDIPILPTIFGSFNVDLTKFYGLELINPQRIWMIVVLITGIDVFGYLLGKLISNRNSFTLTSFVGGFISSTSTTQSLAQKSKKSGIINTLVGAALLANMASFLQIFLLVGPLNGKWLVSIVPSILIMAFSAAILAIFFLRKREPEEKKKEAGAKRGRIFSLLPALKFAGLLITIKIVTKICLILFGKSGFIISSVIASFAGIDAIIVTLAEMAGSTITLKFALITLLLVSATNLLSKSAYSFWQGNRKFAIKFLASVSIIILVSFTGILFI